MTGGDDRVREVLWKALEEAWALIDEEMLKSLVDSMERRIEACIQSKGWYTKYYKYISQPNVLAIMYVIIVRSFKTSK